MKDYRVEIKVKNNLLYKAMVDSGYPTAAELARACSLANTVVGHMLNLKQPLYKKNGEISKSWITVSAVLRRLPEDLIPAQHHYAALADNKGAADMSFGDVQYLLSADPEDIVNKKQLRDHVRVALIENLTPRQAKVVSAYHGLDDNEKTFREIGEDMSISQARARQIYDQSMMMLRRAARQKKLKNLMG
jgi:galactokinase